MKPYVHVDRRGFLYILPAFLHVFTLVIQMSMSWIALLLGACGGWTYRQYTAVMLPWFLSPARKPPDPSLKPIPRKVRQQLKADRPARNLGLAFCLAALGRAVQASQNVPYLASTADTSLKLRCMLAGARGVLQDTGRLTDPDLQLVRALHAEDPSGIQVNGDGFFTVFDSGASYCANGFKEDFVPGSLRSLSQPITLDGIAGDLTFEQEGTVHYEWISADGQVIQKDVRSLYNPKLSIRLISPQVMLDDLADDKSMFVVQRRRASFIWDKEGTVPIPIHSVTRLPVIQTFRDATTTAKQFAMSGCVTDENNQNLDRKTKLLLQYHFRLGHQNMAIVQWLGRQGWLGKVGELMGVGSKHPKCAACQFGKQHKTPARTQHRSKESTGTLSKEQLKPGDLVFTDQYESRTPGRTFESRGSSSADMYHGGTLFVDAASHLIQVFHQKGLTSSETIASKLAFERDAHAVGVTPKTYGSDNGVYASRAFMDELRNKGQGIRMSGAGAQHQNGMAEGGVKIVSTMARTMMLHVALRWPQVSGPELWPMALSHAAHLYNHTPKAALGNLSPMEIFTGSKSDHSQLLNAHTWGCPVYVLDPRLKDGKKIPKWEPRSRRGQYMGASPLHASTVGLIRNLQTGSITPQFHAVYDNFFETVHSDGADPPDNWEDLLVFNRFRSAIDDEDAPELSDEWLTPEELHDRKQQAVERRPLPANLVDHEGPPSQQREVGPSEPSTEPLAPPAPALSRQREPPRTPQALSRPPAAPSPAPLPPSSPPAVSAAPSPPPAPNLGRGHRVRRPPSRYVPETGETVRSTDSSYVAAIACAILDAPGLEHNFRYALALTIDFRHKTIEEFHPGVVQCPQALMCPLGLKATKQKDPDLPTYQEAMTGEWAEEFVKAMEAEVMQLEAHKTWELVPRSTVPEGVSVLPGTWAFRIKRFPNGDFRKCKARFCVRGDRQIEGIHYDEKYSPVVNWSTVRLMLCLAAHQGLATHQIDFSNAFVQADLKETVFVDVPRGFADVDGDAGQGQTVLRLRKSLYGLVQSPMHWFNHLRSTLEALGFHAMDGYDQCAFFGHGMIILTYVDDCLFFAKSQKDIDRVVKQLRSKMELTEEDPGSDVFSFLGVEVKTDKDTGEVELLQKGLIDKILKTCGMADCNGKATPAGAAPLGRDETGPRCQESWNYASVVGMLMYLTGNSRPDITFAVHQCARHSHNPRRSHEQAILRICRYLKATKDRGLRFKPGSILELDCYVDADFAGLWNVESDQDPVCVKSRTGYVITLGGCPIVWASKLQTEVALSTLEAEYIACSQAMRELLPMRGLLHEIVTKMKLTASEEVKIHSTVFEDNNGALILASAPKLTPRTKHIAVKYHFFRSHIGEDKGVQIKKIDTTEQKADIFTKGLQAETFTTIRKLLMGW